MQSNDDINADCNSIESDLVSNKFEELASILDGVGRWTIGSVSLLVPFSASQMTDNCMLHPGLLTSPSDDDV